jgi:hypothetical protein
MVFDIAHVRLILYKGMHSGCLEARHQNTALPRCVVLVDYTGQWRDAARETRSLACPASGGATARYETMMTRAPMPTQA